MPPQSRANAGPRKGKAARRQALRGRRDAGAPMLALVVGGILAALTLVMIGLIIHYSQAPKNPTPSVAGIPCDHLEHTQIHYHAALQIMYHGTLTNLPPGAGIQTDSSGSTTCYYWLHVHQANPNAIHIESPASQTFTVGQFFSVWNQWSTANGYGPQKLDATHVATFTLQPGDKITTYVDLSDGKGATVYSGDPRNIVLKSHEVITIEIGPPDVNPPPTINWTSPQYSGL